jgi:hypothetical protein
MKALPYKKVPLFLMEDHEYWRMLSYLVNKEFTSLWGEIVEK